MRELSAQVEVDVPFHDVDVMEMAWHGHYVKYLELARCALLRTLDYDYPDMRDSGYMWPIVKCSLKYVQPARYGQKLMVTATLKEWENRLRIDYRIRDAATGAKVTEGSTVQVAVDMKSGELQFVSPPALLDRLERAWSN